MQKVALCKRFQPFTGKLFDGSNAGQPRRQHNQTFHPWSSCKYKILKELEKIDDHAFFFFFFGGSDVSRAKDFSGSEV